MSAVSNQGQNREIQRQNVAVDWVSLLVFSFCMIFLSLRL